MNNVRRILSNGSTLLRGCCFWAKKLLFRKNFEENFNAVERVRIPVKFLRVFGGFLTQIHFKTLFEIPMAVSTNSVSFPSISNVSATFSILINSGKF